MLAKIVYIAVRVVDLKRLLQQGFVSRGHLSVTLKEYSVYELEDVLLSAVS